MANARQLDKGKWILQSYKNGKRKTFRGKCRREVENLERDWLNDLEMYGKELKKDKVKLCSLMHEHLFVNIKPTVSAGTFERYMSAYNTHIKESHIGSRDIKDIAQVEIQKFLNSKIELSHSTIKIITILLNRTYNHAIANNLIRIDIMHNVAIPKSRYESKRDIEAFTLEEQNKYLVAAKNNPYNELLIVALSTGMRLGELVALKWENVDLNNKAIKVIESSRIIREYDEHGNSEDNVVIGKPKTSKSNRDIPINNECANMLRKIKLKNGAINKDFVFIDRHRNQIKNDTLSKAHKALCKKAEVKVVNFHCLRHTFATRSIELGIDVKTVSELLGHSDVSITLNKYVHTNNESKRNAIEKISKLISTL